MFNNERDKMTKHAPEKTYPFLMIEIGTDTDKTSKNYGEKYVSVSCIEYEDGRPKVVQVIKSADRFVIEHHCLGTKDQIQISKHNLQKLESMNFERDQI